MNYHEPTELLNDEDMDMHRVLQSIIEEIEAVDWYYQRAAATDNPVIRKLVLHNAHEEIEHALIGIEYLRRTSPVWSDMIDEYLYQDGELMAEYDENGLEKEATLREKLRYLIKEGSLNKEALNRGGKEYLKRLKDGRIDKDPYLKKLLKGKDINNLDRNTESFLNKHIKRIMEDDVVRHSPKRGPKWHKRQDVLAQKIRENKKRMANKGTSVKGNGSRINLNQVLNKGTAAGSIGGYLLSNKMVDDDKKHSGKKKAVGTLGGAAAGTLINNYLNKKASLEKSALNRAEKEMRKNLSPDKIRDILGNKKVDLNNLDMSQNAKINRHVRDTLKEKVNDAGRAADWGKKKIPSGVEKTQKKLFGFIPTGTEKKTTYGIGSPMKSSKRERIQNNLADAKMRNKRKRIVNSIATPGTAIGGLGGYILSDKAVDKDDKNRGKKKAFGTLAGATAGNLVGKAIRGR